MKRPLAVLLVSATALYTLLSFPALAEGIATFDIAAFTQLQQQVQQMQSQYNTLKQQYAAITGNYGRGQIGLSDALSASQVVPGSWQDIVNQQQRNGPFGAKLAYAEKQINTITLDNFADPQSQQATDYKSSTDSVRAALAGGDALVEETQVHLNNITTLSQQIDTTTNIKDAQDLQNRIATETALLGTAQSKLAALNTNLAAQQLNHQNQVTAANQKFFEWK